MNKELSLDVKPFKVYGKTLRVIACKKNYINKKKMDLLANFTTL